MFNPLARQVLRFYNQNQVDSIRARTDDSFKREVSLDQMKTQLNQMRTDWGQWKSMRLEEIENGVARYLANFDKIICDFYLGQPDKDGKVNRISFSTQ